MSFTQQTSGGGSSYGRVAMADDSRSASRGPDRSGEGGASVSSGSCVVSRVIFLNM